MVDKWNVKSNKNLAKFDQKQMPSNKCSVEMNNYFPLQY